MTNDINDVRSPDEGQRRDTHERDGGSRWQDPHADGPGEKVEASKPRWSSHRSTDHFFIPEIIPLVGSAVRERRLDFLYS